MKNRLLILMLLFAALVACGSCYKCDARISKSAAETAVRTFESDSTLQFDSIEIDVDQFNINYTPLNPSGDREYYILETKSPDKMWYVDSQTGEVCMANYTNLWPDLTVDRGIFGPYTQDQCRAIALAFARSKYADFDSQGFTCSDIEWGLNSWGFVWTKTIPPGAITPCFVDVSVNPETGQVIRYAAAHFTIAPITATLVTQQQALDAVYKCFQITNNRNVITQPTLFVDENGNVYYYTTVTGNRSDSSSVNISVTLNAVTGNILWHDSRMSIKNIDDIKLINKKKNNARKDKKAATANASKKSKKQKAEPKKSAKQPVLNKK